MLLFLRRGRRRRLDVLVERRLETSAASSRLRLQILTASMSFAPQLILSLTLRMSERQSSFGGSFGGTMAQAFFSRYKNRVTDLILLSTGAPDRKRGAINGKLTCSLPLPFPLMRKLMKWELSKRLTVSEAPEIVARACLLKLD